MPVPSPINDPEGELIPQDTTLQNTILIPINPTREKIFTYLQTFNDFLSASPTLRVASGTIDAAISVLITKQLSAEDLVSRYVLMMDCYPEGRDPLTTIIFHDPLETEIQLQKSLELALIVAILADDPEAIKSSLYCIGRFVSNCASSTPTTTENEEEELVLDYEDFVDNIKYGQLANLKNILATAIQQDFSLLINVGYNLQDLPEFQSDLCQRLLWDLVATQSLSIEQVRLAQVLTGDVVALIKDLIDLYTVVPGDQEDFETTIEAGEKLEIDSALTEGAETCLCFARDLESALACFHARHGSLVLSRDYYEEAVPEELAKLSALLMTRFQSLARSPYTTEAILADVNFQQAEGDFAFQESFIQKLLQLNQLKQAQDYLMAIRQSRGQPLPDEEHLLQTLANFTIAYLPVNKLKAEVFLTRLFNLEDKFKEPKEFLTMALIALEPSLKFRMVQDRILKAIDQVEEPQHRLEIPALSYANLIRELLIAERYEEVSSLIKLVANVPNLKDRLVDAYLDASSELNRKGSNDSAKLALEEALVLQKIKISRPKIDPKKFASDNGAYRENIKKTLRIALDVGQDEFALEFLQAIKEAMLEIKSGDFVANQAVSFHQIIAEAYFDSQGFSKSKLLKEYFSLYIDPQYSVGQGIFAE